MEDTPIPGYRFLVTNRERLGGKPTIRGTRFSVSFILSCLAEGMSYEDIAREYSDFPRESLAEVLRFAAEITDRNGVAA
ncbi:MAG: antitoxin [Candidatus Rokuibacteriota bacterium]|nr:MAG: antitoxin [Candidatus Rokubacteria bacterium]